VWLSRDSETITLPAHHPFIDHPCHNGPQVRIVLNFMVGLIERAHKPCIVITVDWRIMIPHPEIADNRSPKWI
jgi:hypothetical protein